MLRPINDNILVRLRKPDEVSNGGIHIPDCAQEAEEWGVVQSVGSKVAEVAPDEIVFIKATQGTHYRQGGEDFILIAEHRVLCKLDDGKVGQGSTMDQQGV